MKLRRFGTRGVRWLPLLLAGILGACTGSTGTNFSDAPGAARVAFAPRGTLLDITYLGCGQKSPSSIEVTQTDGDQPVEWVVESRGVFGAVNYTTSYIVRRPMSDDAGRKVGLAEQRDAPLEVVVTHEDEDPIVVERLSIGQLHPSKETLANGETVEDLRIREWEEGDARLEKKLGCP